MGHAALEPGATTRVECDLSASASFAVLVPGVGYVRFPAANYATLGSSIFVGSLDLATLYSSLDGAADTVRELGKLTRFQAIKIVPVAHVAGADTWTFELFSPEAKTHA